jgi:hypothetical protein
MSHIVTVKVQSAIWSQSRPLATSWRFRLRFKEWRSSSVARRPEQSFGCRLGNVSGISTRTGPNRGHLRERVNSKWTHFLPTGSLFRLLPPTFEVQVDSPPKPRRLGVPTEPTMHASTWHVDSTSILSRRELAAVLAVAKAKAPRSANSWRNSSFSADVLLRLAGFRIERGSLSRIFF